MPQYICRTAKNYWIQVEADSPGAACEKAWSLDVETEWETSGFDEIEVEPTDDSEEEHTELSGPPWTREDVEASRHESKE